jgi:signal transduction histidine kinase
MRLSIKAKQVAGVTTIVGLAVAILSAFYLSSLARVRLEESQARGDLLANAIFHRAREVVADSQEQDPLTALKTDDGLRSILEASVYSKNVTYAAIVDVHGVAVAHSDTGLVYTTIATAPELHALLTAGPLTQIRAIYTAGGKTFEVREPLLLGNTQFGSIRIGVSTLLIQSDLDQALRPAIIAVVVALAGASLVAMFMAQLLLRPIHVIRSGLTRLGQGEFGVKVDLPGGDEFGELGQFFNAISARLSADRASSTTDRASSSIDRMPAPPIELDTSISRAEDAVALFDERGRLMFANAAMREALPSDALLKSIDDLLPPSHPYRTAVEETLRDKRSTGPAVVVLQEPREGKRLVATHPVESASGSSAGAALLVRNLDYWEAVQSTINYSRKLAALSRLSAGVAHEIKNSLNATVIHLELLKQQLAEEGDDAHPSPALEHVSVIAAQMHRLDEVVQGFLRFIRPDDLRTQPIAPAALIESIRPIVAAEAESHGIDLRIEVPADLPDIRVDPGTMEQALVNLAINACQAMPNGGRLRIAGAAATGRRVEIVCEDTGHGIKPEDLGRIFNLYFTTKEHGSGIGLSMVYRAVQLNDGEIEVQSTPGRGTTFRVFLPHA